MGFEVPGKVRLGIHWTGLSCTSYKVHEDGIDGGNALYMHTGCLMDKGITMVDKGL